MVARVIIAESLRQADNSASLDWGWRQAGRDQWLNRDGEPVRYVDSFHGLRALGRGAVVYFAWGWRKSWRRDVIEEMCRACGYQVAGDFPSWLADLAERV